MTSIWYTMVLWYSHGTCTLKVKHNEGSLLPVKYKSICMIKTIQNTNIFRWFFILNWSPCLHIRCTTSYINCLGWTSNWWRNFLDLGFGLLCVCWGVCVWSQNEWNIYSLQKFEISASYADKLYWFLYCKIQIFYYHYHISF